MAYVKLLVNYTLCILYLTCTERADGILQMQYFTQISMIILKAHCMWLLNVFIPVQNSKVYSDFITIYPKMVIIIITTNDTQI